jgi:hypothetical protein
MAATAGLHVGWLLKGKDAVVTRFGQFLELLAASAGVFLHLLLQVTDIPLDLLTPLVLTRLGYLSAFFFLVHSVAGLFLALLSRYCLFGFLLLRLLLELCLAELL